MDVAPSRAVSRTVCEPKSKSGAPCTLHTETIVTWTGRVPVAVPADAAPSPRIKATAAKAATLTDLHFTGSLLLCAGRRGSARGDAASPLRSKPQASITRLRGLSPRSKHPCMARGELMSDGSNRGATTRHKSRYIALSIDGSLTGVSKCCSIALDL